MSRRPVLLIFARVPHYAEGKRRMAAHVGNRAALGFQKQRLDHLRRTVARDPRWDTRWVMAGQGGLWCPVHRQTRGDLGERMRRAMIDLAARGRMQGPGRPVVLVGSDIPAMRSGHIRRAFDLLGRYDLVFGPATDGGFWLVGWSGRRPLPDLFSGVPWSCPDTLDQCLARLRALGRWRIGLADGLSDCDQKPT